MYCVIEELEFIVNMRVFDGYDEGEFLYYVFEGLFFSLEFNEDFMDSVVKELESFSKNGFKRVFFDDVIIELLYSVFEILEDLEDKSLKDEINNEL